MLNRVKTDINFTIINQNAAHDARQYRDIGMNTKSA